MSLLVDVELKALIKTINSCLAARFAGIHKSPSDPTGTQPGTQLLVADIIIT
jgi:hypothetical protein